MRDRPGNETLVEWRSDWPSLEIELRNDRRRTVEGALDDVGEGRAVSGSPPDSIPSGSSVNGSVVTEAGVSASQVLKGSGSDSSKKVSVSCFSGSRPSEGAFNDLRERLI